jgi:hypothetical protein
VLIVKKPRNMAASSKLRDISAWLAQKGIKVYVEQAVHTAETPQVGQESATQCWPADIN